MKIVDNIREKVYKLDELEMGEVFKFYNSFYIKTNAYQNETCIFCINLADGEGLSIAKEMKVEPVHCELVITKE